MNIAEEIRLKTISIDKMISSYLPKEEGYQKVIMEAFNYSILAGGKRIRPMLMLEIYRMLARNEKDQWILPFMAGMELIHTYSLVHDDLPAMDNDMYRRGVLTTHAKFGEALGILAGDALLNGAFETVGTIFDRIDELESKEEQIKWYKRATKAFQILAYNAGIYGMIGGQVVDVMNSGKSMDEQHLQVIYDLKTGALLRASFMIGAVMAGADEKKLKLVEKVAYNVGLAFQIQDDVLDVTSSLEVLGKPIHSDEKNEKTTYVTLYGIEDSREKVRALTKEAIDLLQSLSDECTFIAGLIDYLAKREK